MTAIVSQTINVGSVNCFGILFKIIHVNVLHMWLSPLNWKLFGIMLKITYIIPNMSDYSRMNRKWIQWDNTLEANVWAIKIEIDGIRKTK